MMTTTGRTNIASLLRRVAAFVSAVLVLPGMNALQARAAQAEGALTQAGSTAAESGSGMINYIVAGILVIILVTSAIMLVKRHRKRKHK